MVCWGGGGVGEKKDPICSPLWSITKNLNVDIGSRKWYRKYYMKCGIYDFIKLISYIFQTAELWTEHNLSSFI